MSVALTLIKASFAYIVIKASPSDLKAPYVLMEGDALVFLIGMSSKKEETMQSSPTTPFTSEVEHNNDSPYVKYTENALNVKKKEVCRNPADGNTSADIRSAGRSNF